MLALCGLVGVGAQAKFQRVIYVTNTSTVLSDAAVRDALPAIQDAVDKDFAPIWHSSAYLIYIGRSAAPKGSWHIDIVDTPACLMCAGYHDFDPTTGEAEGVVGADLGMNWTGIFTHELFEILGDPWVQGDGTDARTMKVGEDRYVVETADPVEADRFAYWRSSKSGKPVMISDFVTPAWFKRGSTGRWDFTGSCKRPLQILEDGYQLVFRSGQLISLDPS